MYSRSNYLLCSGKPKPAAEVLDRLERKYTKLTKDRAK